MYIALKILNFWEKIKYKIDLQTLLSKKFSGGFFFMEGGGSLNSHLAYVTTGKIDTISDYKMFNNNLFRNSDDHKGKDVRQRNIRT